MILGIGIDLQEIGDFRRSLERGGEGYRARVFTPREIEYCQDQADPYQSFTARFAAKEAAIKALRFGGREGITWHDFEVISEPDGRPNLALNGRAKEDAASLGLRNLQLSLSHSRHIATAIVVAEG